MPGTKRTASGVVGGFLGLIGLSAVAGLLITATVTPAIAVSGMAAKSSISLFDSLPSNLEIDKVMLPTTFYATKSDGTVVEMAKFYEQNRSPVTLNEIAPVMIDALLSSEDNRYFTHGGIDLQGTARALLGNATSGSTTGGSSISQQYVKNVLTQQCQYSAATEEDQVACWEKFTQADGTDGYKRKLQEMRYAISLEQKYSKEDILLGYLNIASFGGTNYGVDAAARYYFNTTAANLTLNQAATIAGMVQSPDTYRLDRPASESNGEASGYAVTKERRDSVLERMVVDGKITQEQFDATIAEPITPVITPVKTGCQQAVGAEYFCQLVKEIMLSDAVFGETAEERQRAMNRDGLSVYTTMNPDLQAEATAAMANIVPNKVEGMNFGSATANVEVGTGRVLAITQNTKFSEDSEAIAADPGTAYSSQVFASDQKYGDSSIGFEVGSTFKLFTLVEWLNKEHSLRESVDGRAKQTFKGTVCDDVTWNYPNPGNFGGSSGSVSTPMAFTSSSLNSGFIAMASKLRLCDIADVANKMGAHMGDGSPVVMNNPYEVLGSLNLSPLAMATAYATVANQGVYCTTHAIDRIVDTDDNELALPEAKCEKAIEPAVANTAVYALAGVMSSGTGTGGNPWDGTQVIGKTGTHEQRQTWMVETSTKVATAAWVGNYDGKADLQAQGLQYYRYDLAASVQHAADNHYPAENFPGPDDKLNRVVYVDLPNVVGKSTEEAQKILADAGFSYSVGAAVPSSEPAGTIVEQSPGAGSVASGTSVTLSPSDGKGDVVPNVVGASFDDAKRALSDAGFKKLGAQCVEDPKASGEVVTATNPAAGTAAATSTQIVIQYKAKKC